MSAILEYPQRHAVAAGKYLWMGEGGHRASFTPKGDESVSPPALPALVLSVTALFPA